VESPASPRLLLLLAIALVLAALPVGLASDEEEPTAVAYVPEWAKVSDDQKKEAEKHGVPVAFENDQGMRFVLVPAGTFRMGESLAEQKAAFPAMVLTENRETQHEVRISRPYYVQVRELANATYRRMVSDHRVELRPDLVELGEVWATLPINGDDHPVTMVSHDDAARLAKWLSKADKQRDYRLPTEAEWEYACRAGTSALRYWGDADTTRQANTSDASLKRAVGGDRRWTEWRPGWPIPNELLWLSGDDGYVMTAPVGSFPPNPWGLQDMLGNVSEWCADWYGPYPSKAVTDPAGVSKRQARRPRFPKTDSDGPTTPAVPPPLIDGKPWRPQPCRVVRGGSWITVPTVRTASRGALQPEQSRDTIGFRLVSPLPKPNER
jgi:formylglycine-generating enzyme required for sulfatase activity